MRRPRQQFPYTRGTAVVLNAGTLNLLAQVKAPGESWTQCIQRIVRDWASVHAIQLHEHPSILEVILARPRQQWDEISENGGNTNVKPS
jgi:hypothetical protein